MEKRSTSSSQPTPKANKAADPRTLFVKFHPPSASITRQHLSDHFSNYGPVNRCSVIRRSKSKASADADDDANPANLDRGSKGYGFVRFVHEEDAKSAAEEILKKTTTKGKKRGGGELMIVDGVQYRIHAERAVDAAAASSAQKKERGTPAGRTDSPSRATKDTDNNANKSKEDDMANFKAETKRKRTSRVIIRNLSFYANEKHVKTVMESNFGPVAAVDLPLVPDLPNENNKDQRTKKKNTVPRHRGFAFVTFTNANAARQAVEQGNEIKIKNRMVAIDFSVSKMEHQKMQKEEKNQGGKEDDTDSESESSDSDSDSDSKEEKGSDGSNDSDSDDDSSDSSSEDDDDSGSESEEESDDEEEKSSDKASSNVSKASAKEEAPKFDESEAKRTLFLRNIPFDAKRHDVFELFRKFGRIEAVYLVKDRQTGVFKGTAFVRYEEEEGCAAAMDASGSGAQNEGDSSQFISSKNMAMGLGQEGEMSGLTLKGRHILVDLAVDRTTASSLAVQRDADGKPIKKMVGKDRRNLYLKNEGRVSSSADGADAASAGAKHGGVWEDLPPGDRAKRERAFADKSTKLRSPLFFINPNRISIRNLSKHINEADLKKLVFGALKKGLEEKLVSPKDAVAHWRAGGELPHSEVMKRATDPNLVIPPLDEKNVRESIPSVYIDRDVSGGRKTADAPSRGFGFVEFTHHTHALAVLRQLNNNPAYSAEYAAGGKHAAEMSKQKRGKKSKKIKADPETGAEFLGEDGKVYVPRLVVEFTAENKVKARQQAEKIAQKKANKIKQRIEKKEKQKEEPSDKKKEKKKGRGALQREKKRARKEAGDDDGNAQNNEGKPSTSKKQKLDDNKSNVDNKADKKVKKVKPQKKRKVDKDEDALEDMIRSYKSSFSKGVAAGKANKEESNAEQPKTNPREKVVKKRWFE